MNSKTEIALRYLKKGLSIIPLQSPSMVRRDLPTEEFVKRCKRPLGKWGLYQTRIPTEKEVIDWFTEWPDANIGIVTGRINNLVVFDLDSKNAEEFAEKKGGFPVTAKVKTGKGYHVYVRHPGFNVQNDVNKKVNPEIQKELDIDIRADGGYVVAPPSIHGSGRQYEWEEGLSIFEIDPAPCEPWMEEYLKAVATTSDNTKKKDPLKPSENASKVTTVADGDSYATILRTGATEGARNHTATKLIGHLFGKGNVPEVVWETVRQWNISKNKPPMAESELKATFDSIKAQNDKNKKPEKEKVIYDVTKFLDTEDKITAEFDEKHFKVPFAGELLKIMESKMNGGLIGGRTYVFGGIPSAGKTGVVNNITDNICLNGFPVLFFSYDDGHAELRYRTYSRFSGFDIEDFNNRRISKSDLQTIYKNDFVSKISRQKYVVQQIIKVEDWSQLVEKIHDRHKKPPVIMIDYLRKIKMENNRADERLRVDEILSTLTNLAKEHNLPVLVISELARDSYKSGQRLSMASFKESGSIEYEASWLGILAAVEEDSSGYSLKRDWEQIINHDGNIDLIVFKAKRGTGETGRIMLKLDKSNMTVRDRIESTKTDCVTQLKKESKFD